MGCETKSSTHDLCIALRPARQAPVWSAHIKDSAVILIRNETPNDYDEIRR